ncbi:hypothetical protein F5878DRAFT_607365 [Lentinula raphanica]|uniref:Uncharacterized protein n=1 Tax=Lentinula raphanica TaxID=153919 RepID=A0AA38UI16_9AGAR|nr:hypothetical protein F5878DRAFT_607365 [Lentinula raphanica]
MVCLLLSRPTPHLVLFHCPPFVPSCLSLHPCQHRFPKSFPRTSCFSSNTSRNLGFEVYHILYDPYYHSPWSKWTH